MQQPLPNPHRQRGAALLLALVVVTVIATLAGSMVWQQWRSVQAESAQRAQLQARWVLLGALDWGRLILREDSRGSQIDHLGEPWALPLQEARLSTFLAEGREDLEDNPALQAFVSGTITDAQSRFNLRNLVVNGALSAPALRTLERVCVAAEVAPQVATLITQGVQRSWIPKEVEARSGVAAAMLRPERLSDLSWWGVAAQDVERLRPWLTLLPVATPLNVNTATAQLLAVAVEGVDSGLAQRIVQARSTAPFKSTETVLAMMPPSESGSRAAGLSVQSNFFELQGRLRLDQRFFEERILVERRQLDMVVISRERLVTGLSRSNPVSLQSP
ncbi:MAG: general secretion pathway protein GspK [Betaproteobacteria bacterium]|nr:general secretion pathway protein GspK [Betaproteobacteria bacterium]